MVLLPGDDYLSCCKVVTVEHVKYGSHLQIVLQLPLAAELISRASWMTLPQQISPTRSQEP